VTDGSAHPRLSLSGVSTWNWSLEQDLDYCTRHGVRALGVSWRKLQASGRGAVQRVRDSGVVAGNIIETGGAPLDAVIDAAVALGAGAVVVTSGPPGHRTWEDAADDFVRTMSVPAKTARARGVHVLLEHTNAFRVDLSFVHTLRDAVDLAGRVHDLGVCMEINACWMERGLDATVQSAVEHGRLGLVQVSDFVVGTKSTPDRAVPGDGHIPLDRIVGATVAAGYTGTFDLELVGPRIEAEGYESAVTRSLATLTALLRDLGV